MFIFYFLHCINATIHKYTRYIVILQKNKTLCGFFLKENVTYIVMYAQ